MLWPNGRIKDKKHVSDVGDLLISSLLNFTTKTSFRGGRESHAVQRKRRSFNRGPPGKMGENLINHSSIADVSLLVGREVMEKVRTSCHEFFVWCNECGL